MAQFTHETGFLLQGDTKAEAVADTIADRNDLTAVRQSIDRSSIGQLARISQYNALIDSALDVPRTLADTAPDRALAQYLDAYVLLDELLAQQALEQPLAGAVLAAAQVGQESNETSQQAAASGQGVGRHLVWSRRNVMRARSSESVSAASSCAGMPVGAPSL